MLVIALDCLRDWDVTDTESAVLLDLTLPTFRRWRAGKVGRIDRDCMTRLRNVLRMHSVLRRVFREPQWVAIWLRSPAAGLNNCSPLAVMLDGELTDLIDVRRYLEKLG